MQATYHLQEVQLCQRIPRPSHSVFAERFFAYGQLCRMIAQKTAKRNLPHLLSRHNERPPNISIFDEAFTIRELQLLCEIQRSYSRCIRYLRMIFQHAILTMLNIRPHWNDNIDSDVILHKHLPDLLGECITHRHPTPVNADTV
jgi:hypothetical protein